MAILNLKRWAKVAYPISDEPGAPSITMELKRLRFDEANRLLVANMEAFAALNIKTPEKPDGEEASQAEKVEFLVTQAHAAQAFSDALPKDLIDTVFSSWIRNVGGLQCDGEPVTTGEDLRDFVDSKMILWLLTTLQSHAALTSMEGKASSSPSTSDSEGATSTSGNGHSPAPSIADAGSQDSTATPIPS